MHIIIDFPTHSGKFFPTPIVWPISDYNFNGMSLATSWFMLLNYVALIVVFFVIFRERKKSKTKTKVH